MNIFGIMKAWYEFKAEHSELTGTHTDLLFYCLDLNNRLAWKEVFGLPAVETSEFLGISYNTFRKVFNDLIELNIIKLVKKSTNQYAANQISMVLVYQNLLKQKKSTYKAFVKAQQKQLLNQSDIDIHKYNNTLNTLIHKNNELLEKDKIINKKNILIEEQALLVSELKKKLEKSKKNKEPLHTPLKEMFLEFYLEKKLSPYYWEVKDAVALNSIIKKIRNLGENLTDKAVTDGFHKLITSVKDFDSWVFDNLSLNLLNSKFNEIIAKIKLNKKEVKNYANQPTDYSWLQERIQKDLQNDRTS